MTQYPSGPTGANEMGAENDGAQSTGHHAGATQAVEEVTPGPRGRGKATLAVVGALAAVGLATGGAYAFTTLSGGGSQPEDALPASTLAFVKVDLDPSSGQKIDALRFMRKFPELKKQFGEVPDSTDLRKLIFEQLQKDGQFASMDYAKDVEPWLGERFALALVPGSGGEEPVGVVALGVKDEEAASASLAKMTSGENGNVCTVSGDYALCGPDKAKVDMVMSAAGDAPLSKADGFSGDMDDLGEDGLLAFWGDLGKVMTQVKTFAPNALTDTDTSALDDVRGRAFGALRFDGTDLEMAVHARDTGQEMAKTDAGTGIDKLPAGTLAALSVNGLGDTLTKNWPKAEKQINAIDPSTLQQFTAETGLSLPGDLAAILGNRSSIVFGGMEGDMPKIALSSDGNAETAQKLNSYLTSQGAEVFTASGGEGTVFALSGAYADEVGKEHGLNDSEVFAKALPEASDATHAAFVDIAGLVTQFGGDVSAEQKANLEPLQALGMTATSSGDDADVLLRLTTK